MSPRRLARPARPPARAPSPRGLALAALLACRPVGPVNPAPVAHPAVPTAPADPQATAVAVEATAPPRPGLTLDADADGPGITADAATQTLPVTTWDGAPNLLAYPPGNPGGWPDLPGRVVGVLWATSLYGGRDDCAARDANDRVEYGFSRGPHPAYALYFPSDGRGYNFLPRWIVPLPDGTTTTVDAAMFRPETPNAWGLHACAHLVELDVNAGRGGRGLHFIATGVRVLDGTTAFPWRLTRVLAELRARFFVQARAHQVARRSAELPREPAPTAGPSGPAWTESQSPGMLITWHPDGEQLDVLLWWSETRTATRTLSRETVEPAPCPPGSPCARRDVGTFERREVQRETVEFAVRYELDRTARVVRETIYTPRHRSDTSVDRVRVHN